MNFYTIENTTEASQWRFGLLEKENQRTSLLSRYLNDFNSFWEFQEPLHLQLWFRKSDNPSHRNLGYCDTHNWMGDELDHNPALRGNPGGFFIIISEQIKQCIESFSLPNHKMYHVHATKEDDRQEKMYYIFHLINEQYRQLHYPKVSFSLKRRQEVIKRFSEGEIRNYDHLISTIEYEKNQTRGVTLSYDHPCFETFYDVVWGRAGEVLLSERIIQKLIQLDLKGVRIVKYDQDIFFNQNLFA